ncbi:HAMP domain-containing sensor histidine kinase [Saliterribacillus persicus]|uniref:histidine kinase n=1 Tax=Saliterribacillus persicus TaxID=930114 RepID=A0A368YAF8_9BACI|nr:HAMP domain-containing histidine kinase [Saliterribacillus persicus]RCW77192.1 hypothetical protein DFR57_10160 [Saliterribacillus persicus]
MKLRTKIQLFLSIVLVVVIIFVNTGIYFLFEKNVLDTEMERAVSNTERVMQAIAQNEEAGADYKQLLRSFMPTNGMIRIITEDEKVLFGVAEKAEYYNLPFSFQNEGLQQIHEKNNGSKFVQISQPLIFENGEIVTLQVTEELEAYQSIMQTLAIVLLIASLVMILPAIFIGYLLSNYFLRPIKNLTTQMAENPINGQFLKLDKKGKARDELYHLETSYNDMIERLNESIIKQQQFVSDASHELKTPISVITSYAELLERWGHKKPEVIDEASDAISYEAKRMKYLTEQLFILARNDGKSALNYETVDLNTIARDVVRSLAVAYNRNIIFHEHDNAVVSADKEKIHQSLYILVDNACKYSDSEIIVRIHESEEELMISIEDFGEGISKEQQSNIFERFYRIDKARSRETGGSGLGLAIGQAMIKAHGGNITVSSEPAKGSIFTIHLNKSYSNN